MKIFRHRNIMGVIFSILALLPIFAVLGRTAYTVVNKNANASYSNSGLVQKKVEITAYDQIVVGETYYFSYENNQVNSTSPIFRFSSISFDLYEKWPSLSVHPYDGFLLTGTNNTGYLYYGTDRVGLPSPVNFDFYFVASAVPNSNPFTNFAIYNYQYVQEKLDNAFEYSLSTFVDDNSFGNINFFTWFTDMFLTNNTHNNLYVHFANWYMNYIMLTSSAYILFLVLMWFINFARRLLERGMNYDF